MASKGITVGVVALLGLTLFAPIVLAQDDLELYIEPRTENARQVADLFNIILWIAMVVFVFVEVLLLYVIFRFRKNKTVPKGETHRGHTQAEIFWTIVPALVFIFIGVLSVQAMENIDRVPSAEEADATIKVYAEQFKFTVEYPNGVKDEKSNAVFLRANQNVRMEVTSKDVIHAVWIPAFALKIDAVPGRWNTAWFRTPAESNVTEYFLQCAEYCKYGHHAMQYAVVVYKEGLFNDETEWGPGFRDARYDAPAALKRQYQPVIRDFSQIPHQQPDVNMTMNEFKFIPDRITVQAGQGVHIYVRNTGAATHNIAIPSLDIRSEDVGTNGVAEIALVPEAGEYEFICAIPGHAESGMRGTLVVQ